MAGEEEPCATPIRTPIVSGSRGFSQPGFGAAEQVGEPHLNGHDGPECEDGGMAERQRISSGSPFEPTIGFSRAVRVGDRVVVSGTGPVVAGGKCPDDAAEQARRCFEIIEAALEEAGASLHDVVRTRMYVIATEFADDVGKVHGELFGAVRPAATMVVVAGLLDPAWKVEIEAEAVVPGRAGSDAG